MFADGDGGLQPVEGGGASGSRLSRFFRTRCSLREHQTVPPTMGKGEVDNREYIGTELGW